jgi:hypothetical protein
LIYFLYSTLYCTRLVTDKMVFFSRTLY